MPASVLPGSHRLLACADGSHRVAEANERNNCRVAAGMIEVADRTPPSLRRLRVCGDLHPRPFRRSHAAEQLPAHLVSGRRLRHAADALEYDVDVANAPGGEDFSAPTYKDHRCGRDGILTPQLPDDRAYYFVVRARDQAGNEDRGTVERRGTNLCL